MGDNRWNGWPFSTARDCWQLLALILLFLILFSMFLLNVTPDDGLVPEDLMPDKRDCGGAPEGC
jgi:hypothetical protein